ncbi:hypothetical protein [Brevibacterium linens]|uniref:Uncharacterized protein n=1 Tax=Brevibacterium linens TaxID=1703 RepID=A0A0B9A1D7_BRELN|nr:hypothetical protein [Brevibacterium linens]KHS52441.1 hypothetical protein AE0388_2091 [Brevibacterium linens]
MERTSRQIEPSFGQTDGDEQQDAWTRRRLAVYAVVALFIVQFARGREWARLFLIVGLGVVGTASLLVEPVMWLFDGADFDAYFGALDGPGAVILVSRLVHLVAVVVGVAAMLTMRPRKAAGITE